MLVLFGGSGSELVLCQQLRRDFISCEIHPEYYQMIQARLADGGKIQPEHKLPTARSRKQPIPAVLSFDFTPLP